MALVELVGPQEAWESLGTLESYTTVAQLHAFTNEMHSDSDVSFTTAEQLSSTLNCCGSVWTGPTHITWCSGLNAAESCWRKGALCWRLGRTVDSA